jgi:hypothetical protein
LKFYEESFCRRHAISDPGLLCVDSYQEANLIFAMFAVYLALGHTLLCKTIKSATISNYLRVAAKHVVSARRRIPNPNNILLWQDPRIDMTTGKNASTITGVLAEVKRWENMPNRREPLTVDMVVYQKLQCREDEPHSESAAMYDWEVFGLYSGNRLTEWAQKDGASITLNIDGTPKAFLIGDLQFRGENRRNMSLSDALRRPYLVHTIDVTWRFQKNGNNGEKKTFVRITDNPDLCAVSALLRIARRWKELKLPVDHPLAVYTTDGTASGEVKFIRETNINTALQQAARQVYNITKKEDLGRFTSHSIRVGACVALHAANVSSLNIQHALRWKSDSFLTYLRNLPCQAQRTARAVVEFNPNRLNLVPGAAAA